MASSSLTLPLRFNRGAAKIEGHGEFDQTLIEGPGVKALQQ